MGIQFDDSKLKAGMKKLLGQVDERTKKANSDIAAEVMRLSSREVPHDIGELQNSGDIDPKFPALDIVVGYNKVYAAKLHEHPEYKFQKGRKGKYLEDPIKNNIDIFRNYFKSLLNS